MTAGPALDRPADAAAVDGPPAVEFLAVHKAYGENVAVDGVDLAVASGEFLTLLGPSGCGKTTLLSMLAGFVAPDDGDIVVCGEEMTGVAPHRRPVNTVFQDYALFPHMSVLDNVAFGVRMAAVPKRKAREQAMQALEGVAMEEYAGLRVTALSGGQRQRVALARALIKQPKVLLLDEPFAALDLQLRRRMQLELRALHRDSEMTFVFVTHDQEEAATLSDRIAVLRDGRVEQTGTPEEIYDHPESRFVAGFIGESNVFDATITASGDIDVTDAAVLAAPVAVTALPDAGTAITYSVRPERIRLGPADSATSADGQVRLEGRVEEVIRVGESVKVIVRLVGGLSLNVATSPSSPRLPVGEQILVTWDRTDGRVLEA